MRKSRLSARATMCGIAGAIGAIDQSDIDAVARMSEALVHRGPDGSGLWHQLDAKDANAADANAAVANGIVLAHRRLSILDLSRAGAQPMEYLQRYVTTYNGEIYNYIELREELREHGYVFSTGTDTEVIAAAYDHWGADCLNHFNGMWAFVVVDLKRMSVFIARDRLGVKPVYFLNTNRRFLFASEPKALLRHPLVSAKPNMDYCWQFLSSGANEHIRETAFDGIYRLEHAHFIEEKITDLALGKFQQRRYWQIHPALEPEPYNEEQARAYAHDYRELLKDAVRLRLRSDVKVGSALSGGLDSSSIVALINQLLGENSATSRQETFSCVYSGEQVRHCDESKFIDSIAGHLRVRNHQIEPDWREVPAEHRRMIYHMDTPPDGTCMSGWHTFKRVAASDVKVTLDGQGADEQLGGYLNYLFDYAAYERLSWNDMRRFAQVPGAFQYCAAGAAYRMLSSFGAKQAQRVWSRLRPRHAPTHLNARLAHDTLNGLVTLIHYSDRASMAHSIESRMPFVDYRLVEFLSAMPSVYKLHGGWTKYIARLAMHDTLPKPIVWRKDKMGWPVPEDYWFKGPLNRWSVNEIKRSEFLKEFGMHADPEQLLKHPRGLRPFVRRLNLATWFYVFFLNTATKL